MNELIKQAVESAEKVALAHIDAQVTISFYEHALPVYLFVTLFVLAVTSLAFVLTQVKP